MNIFLKIYMILFIGGIQIYAESISNTCVTNFIHSGADRLGDQLILYIKTKWLAYKYNISFLLTYFPGAEYFRFGYNEQQWHQRDTQGLSSMQCTHEQEFVCCTENRNFFGIDFNCKISEPIDIELYKQFRSHMKELIQPLFVIPRIVKRANAISIAVHIRKGSGRDKKLYSEQYYNFRSPKIVMDNKPLIIQEPNYTTAESHHRSGAFADTDYPFRFVPEQFYVDQIRLLRTIFKEKLLDIHIFTDYANPMELTTRIQRTLNDSAISFYCRVTSNANVRAAVEDIFLMAQCDCLIRARSHISHVAEFIGDHKIIIFPKEYRWIDKKLVITKVALNIQN